MDSVGAPEVDIYSSIPICWVYGEVKPVVYVCVILSRDNLFVVFLHHLFKSLKESQHHNP